jgi:lysophospholipase L1-like esterase
MPDQSPLSEGPGVLLREEHMPPYLHQDQVGTGGGGVSDAGVAQQVSAGTATRAALDAAFSRHGEASQGVAASLPNLMAAIRGYDDAATPTLRVMGFGSSVGAGATLADPTTQAPVARLGSRLGATVNALGNLDLAIHNGSVNGSSVIDFPAAYAAAKTSAGGTPLVAFLCFGMNDGMVGSYHQGETFRYLPDRLREAVAAVLNDGGDVVLATTPHPRTSMAAAWSGAVDPVVYPEGGVAVPGFGPEASVVVRDWLGTGILVPGSYRHARVNQVFRAVAAELGVVLLDVERYWFAAVAAHGEDALFGPGEYAHPNLLGHTESYWRAVDDLGRALATATVGAVVPRPRTEVFVVKDSNEARTSTTTLADDPQLHVEVGAGQIWALEGPVHFAAGAGNLRVGLDLPEGSTGRLSRSGQGITGGPPHDAAPSRSVTLPDSYGLPAGGNGADSSAWISALVRTGVAGTITVQFCQDSASDSTTVIYANSYLRASRLA